VGHTCASRTWPPIVLPFFFPKHHVRVHLVAAVLVQGNVPRQRQHFDLLVDGYLLIRKPVALKVAQGGALEGADGGEVAAAHRRPGRKAGTKKAEGASPPPLISILTRVSLCPFCRPRSSSHTAWGGFPRSSWPA
jgi:hypothetical protein